MDSTSPLARITSPDLPSPVGPYSPGIAVGDLVFVSGQSGREPHTGRVADDVEAQTEQALRNVAAILEAAGSSLSHVIRCGVFLIDMAEFPKMNAVYARMFGEHRPARTTVEVSDLPGPGLRVEIDAIAVRGGLSPTLSSPISSKG
jgi:2-iminobutanoate/2-iminopropanoate deaminase